MTETSTPNNGGGKPLDLAADLLPWDRDQIDAIGQRARELDQRTRRYIQDNPTTALVAAVAIGFLIGRWLR